MIPAYIFAYIFCGTNHSANMFAEKLNEKGLASMISGEYKSAELMWHLSLFIYQTSKNKDYANIAERHNDLGCLYLLTYSHLKAASHFCQALSVFPKNDKYSDFEARVNCNQAELTIDSGRLPIAEKHIMVALNYYKKEKNLSKISDCKETLGRIWFFSGKKEEAEKAFKESLIIRINLHDNYSYSFLLSIRYLIKIAALSGRIDKAKSILQEAYKLTKTSVRIYKSDFLIEEALIYSKNKEYKVAKEKLLQYFQIKSSPINRSEAHELLAEISIIENKLDYAFFQSGIALLLRLHYLGIEHPLTLKIWGQFSSILRFAFVETMKIMDPRFLKEN